MTFTSKLLNTTVALAFLASASGARAGMMEDLEAAAKKEGQLTVIALPHDWCGYGAVIDGFKKKYGLTVNELNPDGGSGDEIEAIKANKGNTGPQAPDVVDVGLSFGPSAMKEGLLQPYKVSTWDSIPDTAKDKAEQQKAIADKAKDDALEGKVIADNAKAEAERQQELAEKARKGEADARRADQSPRSVN